MEGTLRLKTEININQFYNSKGLQHYLFLKMIQMEKIDKAFQTSNLNCSTYKAINVIGPSFCSNRTTSINRWHLMNH